MDVALLRRRIADLIEQVWTPGVDPIVMGARVTEFLRENGWTPQGSGVFMFTKGNGGWVVALRAGSSQGFSFGYYPPEKKASE